MILGSVLFYPMGNTPPLGYLPTLKSGRGPCPQALISRKKEKGRAAKYVVAVTESLVHTNLSVGGNYYVFSLMTLAAILAMYIYVDIDSGPPCQNERYAIYVRNTALQITAFCS